MKKLLFVLGIAASCAANAVVNSAFHNASHYFRSLGDANGGVVTIDVHVDPDGTWDPEQFEALKIVWRKTGTLF